MESDLSYFRRRASEERTAAINTRDCRARHVHTQMAERYEDLVHAIAAKLQSSAPLFDAPIIEQVVSESSKADESPSATPPVEALH